MKSLLVALMILLGATAAQAQSVWYTTNPNNPQLKTGPFMFQSDCNGFRQYFPNIGWCWWSHRETTNTVVYSFYNRQVGESIGPFGDYWQCRGAASAVVGGSWGDCFAGYSPGVGAGANWYFTRSQRNIGPFASQPQCEQYRSANGGFAACWRY